jgi:hypothetical protein
MLRRKAQAHRCCEVARGLQIHNRSNELLTVYVRGEVIVKVVTKK